jgi:hypothetical protein
LATAILLACIGTSAPRLRADEPIASPALWRAFRPFVIALGDGDPARATRYLNAVDQLHRKLDAKLERDASIAEIADKTSASYQDLNLSRLLELLPERDGAWRFLAMHGAPTSTGYRLFRGAGPSGVERGVFGTSSNVLRMRRLEDKSDERYAVQWRGSLGVGALAWSSLQRAGRDGLRILEEPAADATRAQLLREIAKSQPALGSEDRNVLATFEASFPQTAQLLMSLTHIDDLIVAGPRADGSTRVRLIARWNRERLEQLYPELTDYLDNFGDLIALDARLHDAAGNTLASFWFDSGQMRGRLEFAVRDGNIVPSRAGKLLPDSAPHFERMHAHVNVHSQAMGIQMYVDDFVIDGQVLERERGMQLATQMNKTPRFRIEGAVFGVLPVGVLDWFVPGDIPGLARHMFQVAARSNDGRGIEVSYGFEQLADERSAVDGRVGVDVLDSALIRFGMKIAADRVFPDADQQADMRKLVLASREAFALDVIRFSTSGQLSQ